MSLTAFLSILLAFLAAVTDARMLSDSRRNGTNLRGAIYVDDCKGTPTPINAPTPVNVIVPKCEVPPCILYKGETYDVEMDFDIYRDSKNLNIVIQGIIGGVELPWSGVEKDGCKSLSVGQCPIYVGDYFTYATAIKVEYAYPTTKLIIKWQMYDDMNNPVWCLSLPAEIRPR